MVSSNIPIQIKGGNPLQGRVRIQGSKNASLPVLAATLLIAGQCTLDNCPQIMDVVCMQKLLEHAGCQVKRTDHRMTVNAEHVREHRLPGEYVGRMRSSVILMGALLGRVGQVGIDYPGGCVIGERPIDLHLMALEKLGAQITTEGNYIYARTSGLREARITFPIYSVGATQNALLAAVTARGTTILEHASREPEITALCEFLNAAGAQIEGIGTDTLIIDGVDALHEVEYRMISDRIVAGTYLFATMAAGGRIILEDAPVSHMESVLQVLEQMGASIITCTDRHTMLLQAPEEAKNLPLVETAVYPGFPTDLQSPLMAAACVARGRLILRERIFSGRFKIIEELCRMGARIIQTQDCAVIEGGRLLEGRNVIARELRGGAALLIAGLAADGITTVSDTIYIRRGYENITGDLRNLGAVIGEVTTISR